MHPLLHFFCENHSSPITIPHYVYSFLISFVLLFSYLLLPVFLSSDCSFVHSILISLPLLYFKEYKYIFLVTGRSISSICQTMTVTAFNMSANPASMYKTVCYLLNYMYFINVVRMYKTHPTNGIICTVYFSFQY